MKVIHFGGSFAMSKSVASEIEYFLFFILFQNFIDNQDWLLGITAASKKEKKNLLGILDSQMLLVMILFLFVCLF